MMLDVFGAGLRRPDRHEHRILLSGFAEQPHRRGGTRTAVQGAMSTTSPSQLPPRQA